jgi:hypothetical protein
LEKLDYEVICYEVEQKMKVMNEKIYELADMLETIEVLLE